jgi:predicted DNA-binding protein (UPF0251 family)
MTEKDLARFWSKVNKSAGPDGCWLWTASAHPRGYGRFGLRGRTVYAHRLSYELAYGDILDGLDVCHSCDHPSCQNPAHLFAGTRGDNMADAVNKGRTARGERNGTNTHPERRARGEHHWSHTHPEKVARGERSGACTHPERLARGERHGWHTHPESVLRGERNTSAKLTADQVALARRLYREGGVTQRQLAKRFGVSQQTLGKAIHRQTWKEVP